MNIIRDPKLDKQKYIALHSVKNLIKISENERYFKSIGANDIIVMANMSN